MTTVTTLDLGRRVRSVRTLVSGRQNRRALSLLAGVSLFLHAGFYVGNVLLGDMYHDARDVWIPIAEEVAGGADLYVTATDNAPPVFMYLNSLVYATGYYAEVFYVLLAAGNTAVAVLLWRWLAREGRFRAGVLAGGLYLVSLPLVNGLVINVRSFSVPLVVLAVLTPVAWHRGLLLGAATLVMQFAAFAIPVLLFEGARRSESPARWTGVYVVSGLATGAVLLVPLYVVWGPAALVGGIEDSLLAAGGYTVSHGDQYNPFMYPLSWLENLVLKLYQLSFVLVPAGITAAAVATGRIDRRPPVTLALALAASFGVTLAIRSLFYYWIPVLTFASVLAAYGIDAWWSGREPPSAPGPERDQVPE